MEDIVAGAAHTEILLRVHEGTNKIRIIYFLTLAYWSGRLLTNENNF